MSNIPLTCLPDVTNFLKWPVGKWKCSWGWCIGNNDLFESNWRSEGLRSRARQFQLPADQPHFAIYPTASNVSLGRASVCGRQRVLLQRYYPFPLCPLPPPLLHLSPSRSHSPAPSLKVVLLPGEPDQDHVTLTESPKQPVSKAWLTLPFPCPLPLIPPEPSLTVAWS